MIQFLADQQRPRDQHLYVDRFIMSAIDIALCAQVCSSLGNSILDTKPLAIIANNFNVSVYSEHIGLNSSDCLQNGAGDCARTRQFSIVAFSTTHSRDSGELVRKQSRAFACAITFRQMHNGIFSGSLLKPACAFRDDNCSTEGEINVINFLYQLKKSLCE